MTKVVIDTNVIISGILFSGKPGQIIDLWKNNQIKPYASKQIIDEYIRVLTYPKFQLTEKQINYILYQQILPYVEITSPLPGPVIIEDDPSDDMFLYCCKAAGADILITGDQHLLALFHFENTRILTPDEFLRSSVEDLD